MNAIPKPSVPLIRSSTRKLQSQEETPTKSQLSETEKRKTTHGEDQHNFSRLRKQFRDAKNVIIRLREEDRQERLKWKEHLDDCEPTIDNVGAMVRITMPCTNS
jgi:hypothetical protein